jgi:hypothetical protein
MWEDLIPMSIAERWPILFTSEISNDFPVKLATPTSSAAAWLPIHANIWPPFHRAK